MNSTEIKKRVERLNPFYTEEQQSEKRTLLPKWFKVAASILIALSISIFLYLQNQKSDNNFIATGLDMTPGTNKATLTLADGNTINLSDAQSGIIIGTDSIVYSDGSSIVHYVIPTEAEGSVRLPGNTPEMQLTLTTPKGGQYQVTLPDGTNVWLNATSSLKYPSHFSGKDRRVELEGEAYFEVAKNTKQPFVVSSKGQEVKVLGTQFNINAYIDEPEIKTSLVEGSVQVRPVSQDILNPAYGIPTLLNPGQQALVNEHRIKVRNINLKHAIAWKNGRIEFENSDIPSIMRMLARWYDIEVHYEANFKDVSIGGSISKYKNISEVLKMLEATGVVHFKIEHLEGNSKGRRVTVMR